MRLVATTSGVPPRAGDFIDFFSLLLGGKLPPHSFDEARTASAAPLRYRRSAVGVRSTPLIRVWAVNGTNGCVQFVQLPPAQAEFFLGQNDDAAAFRRFVGERGKLRRVGQVLSVDSGCGMKRHRLAIAESDRAGLIEQQHIHVARRFDRASAHRQHILLHQPINAGDADGAQQSADRGRNQTDQQRDQNRDRED